MKNLGRIASSLAIASSTLLAAGAAVAQPGVPPADPTAPVDPSTTTAPVDPLVQPPPPPAPPPPPPVPAPAGADHDRHHHGGGHRDPDARPDTASVGLGFGYRLPASLETPNIISARLRLLSGLVIEPRVELSGTSDKTESGGADVENSAATVSAAAQVRIPLASRGRAEFMLVGAGGFAVQSQDDDGADNSATATTFLLGYGLGIDYWLCKTLSMSLTASNPILSVSTVSQDQPVGDDIEQTSTSFGAVWDPQLDVLFHLYF